MSTIKTKELSSNALDWAVSTCEGYQPVYTNGSILPVFRKNKNVEDSIKNYSSNWNHGGPIIEQEKISISYNNQNEWIAKIADHQSQGPTPLIAAMRCYVLSKLGNEIEIPQQLINQPITKFKISYK